MLMQQTFATQEVIVEPTTSHAVRTSENASTLSALYDAFAAGDGDAAADAVTDDYVLHVPGRHPHAGEFWGRHGLRKFVANTQAYNGGLFELAVPVFVVTGDDAFTREVLTINRQHDAEQAFVLRVTNQFKMRDGKVSESWLVPEDQYAYDEYYAHLSVGGLDAPRRVRAHGSAGSVSPLVRPEHTIFADGTAMLAEMYREFWRGNGDAMRELIADDVIVNITHISAMSGIYRGWAGYMTFRERLMAIAGDKYKLDVTALAGDHSDVFATEHIRMNRAWDPTVQTIDVIMHFEIRDGEIVRMDDFPVDPYAWESFYVAPHNGKNDVARNVTAFSASSAED
jgi:ketosteroid isomerase-like protein